MALTKRRPSIPPPRDLDIRLEKLEVWLNFKDDDGVPLFNSKAKKAYRKLRRRVQQGAYSDPAGISLYIQIGIDRDGLPVYRCLRGTGDVEGGIHSTNRAQYPARNAAPDYADALLANISLRANIRVRNAPPLFSCLSTLAAQKNTRNTTGKVFRGHYFPWLNDQIVAAAAEAGVKPSFEVSGMLSTMVETNETFFYVPLPELVTSKVAIRRAPAAEPVRGVPVYRGQKVRHVTHLSSERMSPANFIASRWATVVAALPIHTNAEYQLIRGPLANPPAEWFRSGRAPGAESGRKQPTIKALAKAIDWNRAATFFMSERDVPSHGPRIYITSAWA
jgi:hypothetical protein